MGYLNAQSLTKLVESIDAYDDHGAVYDEVFLEIHDRIANAGSAGKADVGALVLWKRIRADTVWADSLLRRTEREVRSITAATFSPGLSDDERLQTLASLDGLGGTWALGSAVLSAWNPVDYGIIDRCSRRAITLMQIWGNELYPMPLSGLVMNYSRRT